MWVRKNIFRLAKDSRGFTLIETAVSWVMLGIIFFSFAVLLELGVKSFERISSRKEALASARYAIDRMVEELMLIKTADIISISATQISFKDLSGANTDYHSASVSGTLYLYRGSDLFAKNLGSFSLTYYDSAGNTITNYADIGSVRRIKAEFYVNAKNGHGTVPVRGEIYPRNFYYTSFQ